MRIYAIADMHGKDALYRVALEKTRELCPDLVVAAGDLGTLRRPEKALEALAALPAPVLAVRGNTDPPRMERLLTERKGMRSLHLAEETPLVGVGGALPLPFRTRLGLWESEALCWLMERLREGSVLVAHPPPLGVRDLAFGRFHAGSRAVADLVRERGPLAVLCGHIHEAAGVESAGATLVVNCAMGAGSAGALVEIADGEIRARMV
jgi:Icc-related predicted phosphoesterase